MTKIEKLRKQNLLSIISMVIVFIGALGVGVALLLSEILYPQIEDLFACPVWYQTFLYASFLIAVAGLVGCGYTKDRRNTTKLELRIEVVLFLLGLTIEVICALARTESYVLNVFICIGGAISSIGFFCGIGGLIGRFKKPKKVYTYIYSDLVTCENLNYDNYPKTKPAPLLDIMEVEKYFNAPLPNDLVDFLLEFNGDDNFLFSASKIVDTTKLVRETYQNRGFSEIDKFLFFGANKVVDAKNLFCYKILEDGAINDSEIYLWNHETNETELAAKTLPELIKKYYNNELN